MWLSRGVQSVGWVTACVEEGGMGYKTLCRFFLGIRDRDRNIWLHAIIR